MSKQRITSRFKMVAIDETYAWSEDIVAKAGKIQQVYLYDERVVTFMCEMTPSYRLIPLYFLTEHRVDDDTHEVMMAQPSEETYIHVRSVDAMKTIDLRKYNCSVRFTNSESKLYQDALDSAVEYFQGNHVI